MDTTNSTNSTNLTNDEPHPKMEELSNLIKEYCSKTILGAESGFFKTLGPFAKEPQATFILTEYIGKYHNMAYKSLILDTDKYFVENYSKMNEISGHSYICLLNITLNICAILEQGVDRTKLDVSNYEKFIGSVENQINSMLGKMNLAKFLSHKCSGVDIKSCNPNEDFVVMKRRVVEKNKDNDDSDSD